MTEPRDLVLAHGASSPTEAEIVRTLLEGEGIFAVIPDRNMPLPVDLTPFDGEYLPAGCQVLVAANEVERARAIIAEARESGALMSSQDLPEEPEA